MNRKRLKSKARSSKKANSEQVFEETADGITIQNVRADTCDVQRAAEKGQGCLDF